MIDYRPVDRPMVLVLPLKRGEEDRTTYGMVPRTTPGPRQDQDHS